MDIDALEERVRARQITVADAVLHTPVADLDETLSMLKRHAPPEVLRLLFLDRITGAPLSEFARLKTLYFKHCGELGANDPQA